MRGHVRIKRLKRGKQYRIVYDLPTAPKPDGSLSRKQKWANVPGNSRKDAEKLLSLRLQQLHSGHFV